MKQEKEKKLNKTFFFKTKDHTLIECFSLQMKYKRYWYSGNTTKSNIIFDVKNGCTPTENGFQNKGLIFFFFLDMPMACGSSWARDQTCIAVATCATALVTLDP